MKCIKINHKEKKNSFALYEFCCSCLPSHKFKKGKNLKETLFFLYDDTTHLYLKKEEVLFVKFLSQIPELMIEEIDVLIKEKDIQLSNIFQSLMNTSDLIYDFKQEIETKTKILDFFIKEHIKGTKWSILPLENGIRFCKAKNYILFPNVFNPPTKKNLNQIQKMIVSLEEKDTYAIGILLKGVDPGYFYPMQLRFEMLQTFENKLEHYLSIHEDMKQKEMYHSLKGKNIYCFLNSIYEYSYLKTYKIPIDYQLLIGTQLEEHQKEKSIFRKDTLEIHNIPMIRSENYVKTLVTDEIFEYMKKTNSHF